MLKKIKQRIINWLTYEQPFVGVPLCDHERIRYELRPCDVILVEGRSRVSEMIRHVTQSSWSHAGLYIGRLHDVDDLELRKKLATYFPGDPHVQLIVEGYLGRGTIVSPLESYEKDHIRICRPRGLSRKDAQKVIAFAINQLGTDYDERQVFDLARFLVPWSIWPRRWFSSLFEYRANGYTKTICSTMIAEAFASIDFPVLPVVKQHEETGVELYNRNPRLCTPRDFDYSPYFEIIKYPFISFTESPYRSLPWNREGFVSHDGENISALQVGKEASTKISSSEKILDKILSHEITMSSQQAGPDPLVDTTEMLPGPTPLFNLIVLRFTKMLKFKSRAKE